MKKLSKDWQEQLAKALLERDEYIVKSVPREGMPCTRCGLHLSYRHAVDQWRNNYRTLCVTCETLMQMQEGKFYGQN